MELLGEFDEYLEHLCGALGHADRNAGLMDYCRGLMLPIERKSVEPLAAHTDPLHVQSKHQSLHHFVADSDWSDKAVLGEIREWVVPALGVEDGCYWIVDDSGHPKYGKHSVGVAHQYCGNLGKTANCQVAVSLSLATTRGSIPIAYQLYLPKEWAEDATRRSKTGVPTAITFATKPQIALAQLQAATSAGVPPGVVLADAAYGDDTTFRPLLKFEWVRRRDGDIPRQRVKGGRSPAKRTLDALNRGICWRMAGCSTFVHPAMETSATTAEPSTQVRCAPL